MVSCVKNTDGFIPFEHCVNENFGEQNSNDNVNHPPHYTNSNAECDACGHKIECIEITRYMSFNLGNAVKYIWRCDLKNDAIEDLRKAVFYLNDEIGKRMIEQNKTTIDK